MKKIVLLIIFICSVCAINFSIAEESTTKLAQLQRNPTEISPLSDGIQGRVSLDLRNIEVVEALKFLSMKAGLNIITTKSVEGRITLLVQNVPIQDIFDIMLRSNRLAYIKEGEIYNIMTEDEYKEIFGRNFSDIRMVKVFRLNYAIPDQAFSLIDALKSEIGRVLVEPDSGMVTIMDTPERIKEIDRALAKFEEKNLVRVFNLKYAKAKDVEEQLQAQLDDKKVGSIKSDERSNQVIVQTLPGRMEDIEVLIAALDKKTLEVLIDVNIIKVKLSDSLSVGIEWEGLFNTLVKGAGLSYLGSTPFSVVQAADEGWKSRKQFADSLKSSTGVGAYPFSGNTDNVKSSTKVAPGERVHVGVINRVADFDAVIQYLQTIGKTQILSNPKLVVINNREAKIHVGERQAYVTSTTTQGQSTSTVSEEVNFVDVGIQLSLTVTINEDGYITMKVKPEISSVVSNLITPSGNSIPIIDTSMAETTVMVKDGASIIIGGLRKEDKVKASKQVPFLGSIPIIGMLFKSSTESIVRTEILIMLTPHIISGDILTTGDETYFEVKPVKEIKEYSDIAELSEFEPAKAIEMLEGEIKPYSDSDFTDQLESESFKAKEVDETEIKTYREKKSVHRRKRRLKRIKKKS